MQTHKIPIQTHVNRIFVTQHRSKARVTFAYVSFTYHLIISSHLALGLPVLKQKEILPEIKIKWRKNLSSLASHKSVL